MGLNKLDERTRKREEWVKEKYREEKESMEEGEAKALEVPRRLEETLE